MPQTDADGSHIIAPGETLAEAIKRAGLQDEPTLTLAGDEDRYLGYLEAHIEQVRPLKTNPLVECSIKC